MIKKLREKILSMGMYAFTKYWFFACLILLFGWFLSHEGGLLSHMPLFIWIVTAVAVLYKAKNSSSGGLSRNKKIVVVALGFFFSVFSFFSVDLGFGNPPYSIAEFSILLSGLTLIAFAYLEFRPILLPSAIPLIAVLAYQAYELVEENVEWLAEPLLEPTTVLSVFVLNLLGLKASSSSDYIITFLTQAGKPMYISIVIDCTGIWSLGAFTASVLLVALVFPKVFSRTGALFIALGYIGTYAANILRITLISLSAYLYGASGATEIVHVHAGWFAFSVWMTFFWYLFFSRYLLKK